ncbi:MAG: Dabb family protein [Rubrivivax sp.]
MIKHIVMWNVRGDDAQARARAALRVKAEFESLRGRVPGLLHLEVGVDESRIDYACDVVLYTEFASREALAAYAEHPEHLRDPARLPGAVSEPHPRRPAQRAAPGRRRTLKASPPPSLPVLLSLPCSQPPRRPP